MIAETMLTGALVGRWWETIEYRSRSLVRWNAWGKDWTFPQCPNAALLRAIQLQDLDWPKESLWAPEQGPEDQEREGRV